MMGLTVHRMGIGPAAAAAGAPLDDYTSGLICCYGTIQLLSSYTDPLLRVSRSSDSTEQDIGQSSGILDTTALSAFVGANNGQCEYLYDQLGVNTATAHGVNRIVESGAVVTSPTNSIPSIKLTAQPSGFDTWISLSSGVSKTVIARVELLGSAFAGAILAGTENGTYVMYYGSGTGILANTVSTVAAFVNGSTVANRGALLAALSGVDAVAAAKFTTNNNSGWSTTRVFGYNAAPNSAHLIAWALYDELLSDADIADISTALGSA